MKQRTYWNTSGRHYLGRFLSGLASVGLLGLGGNPGAEASTILADLDDNAAAWGMYIDPPSHTAYYDLRNVTIPSLDGTALQLSMLSGPNPTPYTGLHAYCNLPYADASSFELRIQFRFASTAYAIQALEFTMNKWDGVSRYEFATQWENVWDGTGSPRPANWRIWDGAHWQPFGYNQSLTPDTWHSLALTGDIEDSKVHYLNLVVDGVTFALGQTYAPVLDPASKLAVAVQLDGDAQSHPQPIQWDRMDFRYGTVPEGGGYGIIAASFAGLLAFGRTQGRRN